MSEISKGDIVGKLRKGVSELSERYREVLKAKEEAENLLSLQKDEITALKAKVEDVEAEYNKLITARGLVMSEGDIKSARLRVNKLVREIDKCISLLNN